MRALITGITGQDGSYLAELLLEKGYEVHGLVRPGRDLSRSRVAHLFNDPVLAGRRLFFHTDGLLEAGKLAKFLEEKPCDEIYHLAAQSQVGLSFEQVEVTCETLAMGTMRLLEAIRLSGHPARFFHAASSEIFGQPESAPQDERTPQRPRNPYGCAKAFAFNLVSAYRERFGFFGVNGILFNHESPRRGENFVTKKICLGAAAIKAGRQRKLVLGSLEAQRDWGDARDFVRGMWLSLQHSKADDFVFATGELHSVQEVVRIAFETLKLEWEDCVEQDPRFMRPAEPVRLVGNARKAEQLLGWKRTRKFEDLIVEMAEEAYRSLNAGSAS